MHDFPYGREAGRRGGFDLFKFSAVQGGYIAQGLHDAQPAFPDASHAVSSLHDAGDAAAADRFGDLDQQGGDQPVAFR